MARKASRKTIKGIKKYTALVPKTMKATKSIGTAVVKKINYFLSSASKTIKKTAKSLDRTTAKSIRSFTKRKIRR